MKKSDIIALQEHWLYNYEKKNLSDFCGENGFSTFLKSVDDDDPLLPTCRPRGKGGVGFLWTKDLDSVIEVVHDGDSRMIVLLLHVQDCPVCMINVYMPCRGLNNSESDFRDTLDQIQEVINKYCHAYRIVLMGDLNASLTREDPSSRDKVLRKFCESQCLSLCDNYPSVNTFIHPNGKSKSQIDYILCMGDPGDSLVNNVQVYQDPLNTSTHLPVRCLMPPVTSRISEGPPVRVVNKKVLWTKLDKSKYQSILASKLDPSCVAELSLGELEFYLQEFCSTMVDAALDSAPRVKPGKKKRLWTLELQKAASDGKKAHFQWKQAGKPGPEHPLSVQKRVTKKQLRTLQRQQQSEYRSSIYNNIMEAHTSDRKLFYSLVNRQRKEGSTSLGRLVVDDVHLTTSEAIRQGWATYFQNLATPKEKDNYNIEYKQQVDLDFELICDICSKLQSCTPLVSQTEVEQIIKSLKNNKAMDGCGVSAEHLKYGGSTVVEFVTCVLNEIFRLGRVPEMFKLGFITPIYKKHGKPIHDPNSYRRITITSLIGKVLEKYILQTAFAEIERKQNPLQKGFTKGTSATTAALMFTEALAEAKDTKTTLYAACIDASKAFDVVWHHSMLRKLFSMGLTPASWNILKDSYTGMSSVVNWGGELSKPFVEQQGVRQGGIISPSAYKMFLNPLLDLYSSNSLGLQIGNVYLGSPACADDLLFLAKTATELQEMIFVQEFYANAERYDVSDTKTKVFIANSVVSNETWNENSTFVLNGRKVEVVEECVHLGITRDSKSRSGHAKTIDERIQSARRCAYSLMGAGLHGQNGVNPLVSFTMWNVFILPCLLYGLDVLTLVKSDIAKITQFHKKFLKQIMHLPDRTADAAVYMLSGQIPVEGEIHKRTLGALGGILRSDSVERRLAERQIHVKDGKSKSWFVYVNKVLEQYGLPSTLDLLDAGYAKAQWKSLYEQAVNEYWSDKILEEAMGKTSMRFMNVQNYPIGLAHLVWRDAGYDIMSVQRAGWKARLMSGTYMLQATRARFNQFEVDPTCLLCFKEPENIEHFLLRCESLNKIRQPFLDKIYKLIQNSLGVAKLNDFKINDTEFTAILLDCTVLIDPNSVLLLEAFLHEMETFSRGLCYALHMKRTSLLSQSN